MISTAEIRPGAAGQPAAPRSDRGMVTVELAVGMLAAALLATMLAAMVFMIAVQVRCSDVAAQMVRHAARGDEVAVELARARAPQGALTTLERADGLVRASVRVEVTFGRLGPVPLQGSAELSEEPA